MKIALSVSEKEKAKSADSMYFKALVAAGALPEELTVVGPNESPQPRLEDFDGILFAGGEDIDPTYYGQKPRYESVQMNRVRDEFELVLLGRALERRIPILGVCRGIQVANVKFGGTLYQDLPQDRSLNHKQLGSRGALTHSVVVTDPDSYLGKAFTGSCRVNSLHHQAIDRLGRGLKATAYSDDGLVEAVEAADGSPLVAVQWHPEELVAEHPEQLRLLEQFVQRCRERSVQRGRQAE